MSKFVPMHPYCEGCSRPVENTPGMVSVRKGGMRTYLCWDCIDDLHAVVQGQRAMMREAADD